MASLTFIGWPISIDTSIRLFTWSCVWLLRAFNEIKSLLWCQIAIALSTKPLDQPDESTCTWTLVSILKSLQVYCGPVPQIDNGFAVAATNVSFNGAASYQCYAGFGFPSGQPIETITCNADGQWSFLPVCQGMYSTQLQNENKVEWTRFTS